MIRRDIDGGFVRDIVNAGLSGLVRSFGAFVFNKRKLVFYRLGVVSVDEREWSCPKGIKAAIFDDLRQIPEKLRKEVFGRGWVNVLYFRLMRKKAQVVVLTSDTGECVGYGWIQDWGLFRRLFKCVGDVDYMVGPGWIHPDYRGRRLHPVLLAERLRYLSPKAGTVATFADAWNIASIRGIERVGFQWWGDVEMFRVFLVFRWARRIR